MHQSSHQYLPSWNSERKSTGFNVPISPFDRDRWYPRCNSDIQGAVSVTPSKQEKFMATVSQHGIHNRKKAPLTPHVAHQTPIVRNVQNTPKVTFNPLSTNQSYVTNGNNATIGKPNLYYRKALPKDTKWSGTGEDSFEEFLVDLNAHISQQIHLIYIIQPAFITLWLQHGVIYQVLGLVRRMNLSYSLNYISEEQFVYDLNWLFGALKQAIGTGRGSEIVLKYEASQDGIAVYHALFDKFYYVGDLKTFMTEMETILNTDLTRGYPGGPLKYPTNWETAVIRL